MLASSSDCGELQRRLAAELHDGAVQAAVGLFTREDLGDVLGGERLEIEPVRGVVVGRHRLRIAVDHDGLVPGIAQGERGMAAAIVELDALADAVRPAAEDGDLGAVGGLRLVGGRARERRLVGRVHVGGGRGELGRAGVDALEDRAHAQRVARRAHLVLALAGELGEARVGEAHAPSAGASRRRWPAGPSSRISASISTMARMRSRNHGSILQLSKICSSLQPSRIAWATCSRRSGVGVPSAARMAFLSSPWPRPSISISSRPVRPVSSERSAFCRLSSNGAADRHHLAHRLHRGGEVEVRRRGTSRRRSAGSW